MCQFKRKISDFLYLLGTIVLMFFSSCETIVKSGYISGPTRVVLNTEQSYQFNSDEVQSIDNLRWHVKEGDLETVYEGGVSITHTFTQEDENAVIELYSLTRGNKRSGRSFSIQINVVPFEYKVEVINSSDLRTANAQIKVYKDSLCTLSSNFSKDCLIESATTNSEGQAVLSSLELGQEYALLVSTEDYESNLNNNSSILFTAVDQGDYGAFKTIRTWKNTLSFFTFSGVFLFAGAETATGIDIWDTISDCRKDDFIIFDRDFNWAISEGDESCVQNYFASGTYSNAIIKYLNENYLKSFSSNGNSQITDVLSIGIIDPNNIRLNIKLNGGSYFYYYRRAE